MLDQLYNLKRDRGSGWEKPYKSALLLALIDQVEQVCPEPVERDNRFSLSEALNERYRELIDIVGRPGDHDQLYYPFWHFYGDKILPLTAAKFAFALANASY